MELSSSSCFYGYQEGAPDNKGSIYGRKWYDNYPLMFDTTKDGMSRERRIWPYGSHTDFSNKIIFILTANSPTEKTEIPMLNPRDGHRPGDNPDLGTKYTWDRQVTPKYNLFYRTSENSAIGKTESEWQGEGVAEAVNQEVLPPFLRSAKVDRGSCRRLGELKAPELKASGWVSGISGMAILSPLLSMGSSLGNTSPWPAFVDFSSAGLRCYSYLVIIVRPICRGHLGSPSPNEPTEQVKKQLQ